MRLIISLAVILLTACATTVAEQKTIPITVIGEGTDLIQAKNNGFQKAIEQEVGVVLLSNKEVQNSKLVKDKIITHSSGYIHDYKIHNTDKVGDIYYITMDVYVKSSAISERVLGVIKDSRNIDGEKINEQYTSYNNSRKTGDELLNLVLSDYPKSAYVVTNQLVDKDDIITVVDRDRNPVLIVPFQVTFNYNFLKSLNESLKATSDKQISGNKNQHKIVIRSKKPNSFFNDNDAYYVNDTQRAGLIKKPFYDALFIKLVGIDNDSKKLFYVCQQFKSKAPGIFEMKEYLIDGTEVYEDEVAITFKNKESLIKKINAFQLTIQKENC